MPTPQVAEMYLFYCGVCGKHSTPAFTENEALANAKMEGDFLRLEWYCGDCVLKLKNEEETNG